MITRMDGGFWGGEMGLKKFLIILSQLGKLYLTCAVAMATEVNNVDSIALDRVQTGHEMTRTRPRGQKFTVGRKKHSECEDSQQTYEVKRRRG